MTEMKSWAHMNEEEAGQYLRHLERTADERWSLGIERYHSDVLGFQGDPLDHAEEEGFDILLYLWMAKRKQRWLEARIQELERQLAQVKG